MEDKKNSYIEFKNDKKYLNIEKLKNDYKVSEIHIGHRKTNAVAGKLYESLGFVIFDEDETDYFRSLDLNQV